MHALLSAHRPILAVDCRAVFKVDETTTKAVAFVVVPRQRRVKELDTASRSVLQSRNSRLLSDTDATTAEKLEGTSGGVDTNPLPSFSTPVPSPSAVI